MSKKIRLGFDLGATKMLVAAYDDSFKKLCFLKQKTQGASGKKNGLKRIIDTINVLLQKNNLDKKDILSLGIGIPGPIHAEKGIAIKLSNMNWHDVEVEKELSKEFQCPVKIINDVDAGTFAECEFGGAKKAKCAIGIFPGTGIGGACVKDGVVYEGTISSMEIGHIKIQTPGFPCGCGNSGCLETFASRLAIAGEVSKAAYRGEAPYIMQKVGTDIANIKSGILAKAIENGDVAVKKIILNACFLLGQVTGSVLVNLFSPDYIILGGGLIEAMPELFVEEISRVAKESCMPVYKDSFKVVAATLGDDSTVLGAAAWAKRYYSNKKNAKE